MNWSGECAVIIPCLNESSAIGSLVRAVRAQLPAVLVVDDGSIDDTSEKAVQAGAEVVRHGFTKGKGAALQAGWNRARNQGFKWALTMDGDGQHSPSDIPKFLKCAEQTGADLVIGNRMGNPAGMPWLRRRVNLWMSRRISSAAQRSMPDSQCGFRLIHLEVLAGLSVNTAHFEIESEVLLAFARAGLRIEFVPIQVIYKTEQSKINPLRDTVRWFKWWRSVEKHEAISGRHGAFQSSPVE
ncbi:MAG TPA: glycosyltransferase family 2 protein [Candidatus Paceibacterota bacterium]|nr:glycosyltransferase family 2 protein [Candidatus Paceibacterota bacterium]